MPTARIIIFVAVIAVLPALVRAEQASPPAAWNLRDRIPLEEVVVQSHRGAGALSPRVPAPVSWPAAPGRANGPLVPPSGGGVELA